MQVDELALIDPGQDGPSWTWTGPGFPPEACEEVRQDCARQLLRLQRQFCLSNDPVHALTAMTLCQIYRAVLPPWVEAIVARLAWAVIMAPDAIKGRRIRQAHWIRFMAVNDHLRRQLEAGVKKPNKRLAYREVSAALRGQVGRGDWTRVEASYLMVVKAIRRGEADRFALGTPNNRYSVDGYITSLSEADRSVLDALNNRYSLDGHGTPST